MRGGRRAPPDHAQWQAQVVPGVVCGSDCGLCGSQHLAVLEEAGLVHTRREGRYTLHHRDTRPLNVIVERWLTSHGEDHPCGSP
jgi:bacterioferritin-associated ferredoxin